MTLAGALVDEDELRADDEGGGQEVAGEALGVGVQLDSLVQWRRVIQRDAADDGFSVYEGSVWHK